MTTYIHILVCRYGYHPHNPKQTLRDGDGKDILADGTVMKLGAG